MLKLLQKWIDAVGRFLGFIHDAPNVTTPSDDPLPAWRPLPVEQLSPQQLALDHLVQRRSLAPADNEDLQTEFFESLEDMRLRGIKPRLISGKHAKNGWLNTQTKGLALLARISYIRHFLSVPDYAGVEWSPSMRKALFLNFSETHDSDAFISTEDLLEDTRVQLEWGLMNLRDAGLVVTMQVVRPE